MGTEGDATGLRNGKGKGKGKMRLDPDALKLVSAGSLLGELSKFLIIMRSEYVVLWRRKGKEWERGAGGGKGMNK